MAHEINSYLGPNVAPIQPNYTVEEYEYQMDRLMSKKKARKYTM